MKMNRSTKKLIAATLVWGCACPVWAGSGASFLKIGAGARAQGLGTGYTAVADDVTAFFWNPAGLARLERREVSATHAELYQDTRYDFAGYAHPTRQGTFGIAATYLSQGSLEGRSASRQRTSDFGSSDLAVSLGGSRIMAANASVGLSAKLIRSEIAGLTASGFAFDLGGQWKSQRGVSLGLSALNLGPSMNFNGKGFNLPLTLASGVGVPLFNRILLSADFRHAVHDARTEVGMGGELSLGSALFLRAGYASNMPKFLRGSQSQGGFSDSVSNLSGFGAGFGLKLKRAQMDYSFTPMGELGNSQRLSLSFKY